MTGRKILSVIASVALVAAMTPVLTGCGTTSGSEGTGSGQTTAAESDGELTTVRFAIMTSNIDHYYAIVGQQTGIFEEHGLDVELTEFAAGVNTVDAITTGQADIGMLADYALVNRFGNTAEATDLDIIARFAYSTGDASYLYVNPDTVSSLSDLAGQAIITLPGTVWDYWTGLTIEAAGLTTDEVEVLEVDSAQSALAVMTSGEGVAFWASGVNGDKLEEAGMVPLMTLQDLATSTDQYFISSDSFMTENAEVATAFLEAIADIEAYIQADGSDAASIVADELGIEQDEAQSTIDAVTLTLDFTQGTLEHLEDIQEWALENGSFTEAYDTTEFLSLDVLRALYPDAVEV